MRKSKETWKPVTCTDIVMYEVSSEGKVRNLKTRLIIATYPSVTEASLSTGIKHCNISSVARGKRKTAGGYGWKYQNYKTN